MIESIRDYVIHLTASALVCSVVFRFTRGSGAVRMIMKLLCGIYLAYSIIQPVRQMDFKGLAAVTEAYREEAEQAVQWGKNTSRDAWSESISQGTEAYILEKAKALDLDLLVEVELSNDEMPVPVAVSLTGRIAPYAKSALSDIISQDLNIPKENQTWISK